MRRARGRQLKEEWDPSPIRRQHGAHGVDDDAASREPRSRALLLARIQDRFVG